MTGPSLTRRNLLRAGGLIGASLPLSGCKLLDNSLHQGDLPHTVMSGIEGLTYRVQRLLSGNALATEYAATEIRQGMRANGVTDPQTGEYLAFQANEFRDYRLEVGGLVARPLSLSLSELQNMPARTQITRHDCVEGWSCIASWTGVPLAAILEAAGAGDDAAFVVFRCMDTLSGGLSGQVPYYESIDMQDARHPQTILAYAMNGALLPVANGAPLRVRVERQLGYKMAKYIRSIEVVGSFAEIGGNGGYWPDAGYSWYAGI